MHKKAPQKDIFDKMLSMPTNDVELQIERDRLGRITRLGYTVGRRKSDKTVAEFQQLVKTLLPDVETLYTEEM